MIASCPQCAMSLTFDDERLPTEPFNVLCPRCRQSVTIMPPPKEEPRLPGTTGILDMKSESGLLQSDPLRQLADLLLAGMKQAQPQTSQLPKWQRRGVLICLDDAQLREGIRAALDASRYEIFSADFAPEAIEILHESRAEVIVLSPSFDADHQGGGAMMQYINSLTPQVRRRTYVVLVSPQLRTLDTYLAFANGVNLTVHPEDFHTFQSIFERSLRDYNELYRPLNQASAMAQF
ncbi:MAG TPA: zinc-ribbon domain-containing protein [Blastocatellia bacterium]|nr:zinc-ribbon domain-containing protein [Blastocatellia bacterium]